MKSSNSDTPAGLQKLREIISAREERERQYESEKVFDYDIDDYDNWSAEWYEAEDPGVRCQACYGTGLDRYEDADCIECWGEGVVYGSF